VNAVKRETMMKTNYHYMVVCVHQLIKYGGGSNSGGVGAGGGGYCETVDL
jgi:hypothetical protein